MASKINQLNAKQNSALNVKTDVSSEQKFCLTACFYVLPEMPGASTEVIPQSFDKFRVK